MTKRIPIDRERVKVLALQGVRTGAIAAELSISPGSVSQAIRAMGLYRRNSRAATQERRARIRQMAAEGHTVGAIAKATGICEGSVYHVLAALGIPTVGKRIGRVATVKINNVMTRLIDDAVVDETVLAVLYGNWADLDRAEFRDWKRRLEKAIWAYRQLSERLGKENRDDSGGK